MGPFTKRHAEARAAVRVARDSETKAYEDWERASMAETSAWEAYERREASRKRADVALAKAWDEMTAEEGDVTHDGR